MELVSGMERQEEQAHFHSWKGRERSLLFHCLKQEVLPLLVRQEGLGRYHFLLKRGRQLLFRFLEHSALHFSEWVEMEKEPVTEP